MPSTKLQRMGFYTALALIVGVGMLTLYPLGQEIFADSRETPGRELQNEVKRTHNQAEDLDKSLSNMIPVPPQGQATQQKRAQAERRAVLLAQGSQPAVPSTNPINPPLPGDPPTEPQPSEPGTGVQPPGGSGIGGGGTGGGGGTIDEENPGATPAIDFSKYDDFANPADKATAESLKWMNDACIELECPENDQYVAAVQQLYNEWDQRYQEATNAHKRFAWRISRAKVIANEYFTTQYKLTESMPNRQRRNYYRERDKAERLVFLEWQTQADEILSQSNVIMDELRQMNIELSKQVLSAQFASVYREFEIIPIAITNLHYDLNSFRVKSRELETRFGAVQTQEAGQQ